MTQAPAPPFPQFRSAGQLVFTSGQIAVDLNAPQTPAGLRPVSADVRVQAHVCLDRLDTVLRSAGSSLSRVLRVECFLADAAYLGPWHEVFLERFPIDRPARTTLVAAVPAAGFLIEVQAIATVDVVA